jgi:hypothetical protein
MHCPNTLRRPWHLLALFLLFVAQSAGAGVYKWVDEKGVTHYSEAPPQGRKSEAIRIDPPPPPGATPPGKSLREQESEFLERQLRRQQQEEADKRAREDKAANEARCAAARERLERLQAARRVFRRDAQGEPVIMSDEERQAAIEETAGQIEATCKP